MENLTKNTVQFLDVVKMALSSETSQWDDETLTRVFDWAAYFEKIHSRLPSKPHLVQELDTKMKQISIEMGLSLGKQELGFDFLGQAAKYVECVLLQNENLDRNLYRQLLLKYGQHGYNSNSKSALVEDVSSIRAEGAKMQFLQSVQDLAVTGATSSSSTEAKTDSTVDYEVEIRLIRELVVCFLSHHKADSKHVKDAITSLVNDAGSADVVVEALLYRNESETASVSQQVNEVLTTWLVARTEADATLWFDLDPDLLGKCVDNIPGILEEYVKFLVDKVKLCQTQQFHPYKTSEMTGLTRIENRLIDISKRSEHAKKACMKLLQEAQLLTVQVRRCKGRNAKGSAVWDKLIRMLEQ